MNLIEVITNAVRVPELRRRVLFTLGMLAVYRLGSQIPLPGIHIGHLESYLHSGQDNFLAFANLFSGGNVSRMTIFALGITPYITASIILQLMAVVVPSLARLRKEGELGRKKITEYTRYFSLVLAMAESVAAAFLIESLPGGLTNFHGVGFYLLTMLSLTTGTMFLMWLGEQITERGLGNGISLLIFANIVTGIPKAVVSLYVNTFETWEWSPLQLAIILVAMVLVVALVVLVERGERRIPVQYAKRITGRSAAGVQTTHIPMRVNAAGVVPVIFASSMLGIPPMLGGLPWIKHVPLLEAALAQIRHGEPLYYVLFGAAVLFFCFFYVSIIFDPTETADNLRKYGGFVASKRPGKETSAYFDSILTRLTVIGALYLVALCLVPDIMLSGIKLQHLPLIGSKLEQILPQFLLYGLGANFYFGGTSLLIVTGVAMDLINQVEAQLIMRHYETYTRQSGRKRTWRAMARAS